MIDQFDLQLSGHTHGGQIVAFNLLTRLQYRAKPGLKRIGTRSRLYLSRGTGAWGPQIRILAPPELTVFEMSAPTESDQSRTPAWTVSQSPRPNHIW